MQQFTSEKKQRKFFAKSDSMNVQTLKKDIIENNNQLQHGRNQNCQIQHDYEKSQKMVRHYFYQLFGQTNYQPSFYFKDNLQNSQKQKTERKKLTQKQSQSQQLSKNKDTLFQKFIQMKTKNLQKYQAIANLLYFLYQVRSKIILLRFDTYSIKVFIAFKNSCSDDLKTLLFVLKKIYSQIFKYPNLTNSQVRVIRKSTNQTFSTSANSIKQKPNENEIQVKNKEFLILLRFLTSEQKILQLIKNEQIQTYYIFLIENLCLGHYNNQANKKTPQKRQIQLIKNLLTEKSGKQIFQKICSINHGNKLRRYDQLAYQTLYGFDINTVDQIYLRTKKKFSMQEITKMIYQKRLNKFFDHKPNQNMVELKNQSQRQESSDQFLNNCQKKNSKKINVKHFNSLELPQKQLKLNFNVKKVSSIQIQDLQKKQSNEEKIEQKKLKQ